jgi:exopolyphosphatase/pppGpp-phosphohydrolase
MNFEQLAKNQYIGENRAPIIVAATVIFKEIYDTLQIKVLTASLKGAQDAIIEELRQKWQS